MKTDIKLKTQMGFISNVYIRCVNTKTGEVREVQGKNKITRDMLVGISNLIHGDFISDGVVSVSATVLSPYYSKYVGLGAGSTAVTYTDTDLETPLYKDANNTKLARYGNSYNSNPITEDVVNSTITITYKFFVPSEDLTNTTISEVALFPTENNPNSHCLARYIISPAITKGPDEFIDVIWSISLVSA